MADTRISARGQKIRRISSDEWRPCRAYPRVADRREWGALRSHKARYQPSISRAARRAALYALGHRRASLVAGICKTEHASSPNEIEFNLLADQWENATRNYSSPKHIVKHPLAREIVNLGEEVVPMILRRMQVRPWFWFDILMEVTASRVDPVDRAIRGDMQRMTEAWIEWGADRGII